jgi:hypothetical protein
MKRLLLAIAAIVAMTASGAAAARVDVDISIGGPDIILGGPDPILDGPDCYYPPVRYVERRPRVLIMPEYIYRRGPVYRSHFHRESYRWQPEYRRYGPPQFAAPQFRRPHQFRGHPSRHRGWRH